MRTAAFDCRRSSDKTHTPTYSRRTRVAPNNSILVVLFRFQHLWVSDTAKTQIFLNVVRLATKDLSAVSRDRKVTDWLNEAFKILFNTYCHAKMFDADMAQSIADECGRVVRAENVDVELKQNAINVLATMPLALPALVPKVGELEASPIYIRTACLLYFRFPTNNSQMSDTRSTTRDTTCGSWTQRLSHWSRD